MIKNVDVRNLRRYRVIDIETGDEDNLANHFNPPPAKGWNQTYPQQVAKILQLLGGSTADAMAYIITHKNTDNCIIGSAVHLAEKANVSKSTMERTLKMLQSADLLRKVQNGLYMVNPDLLSWGGVAYMSRKKAWEDLS